MRRLLLVLLALCLPVAAGAKLLVVADLHSDAGAGAPADRQGARLVQGATDMLDRFGVCYTLIQPSQTKTEFCRTGDQVWNFGTGGAYVEHFDAVLHLNWAGSYSTATNGYYPRSVWGYYPDSMLVKGTTCAPTVPQLFAFGSLNSAQTATGLNAYSDRSSPACSTGVGVPSGYAYNNYIASSPGMDYVVPTGRTTRWMSVTNQGASRMPYLINGSSSALGGCLVMSSTQPTGGARALVGMTGAANHISEAAQNVACLWCDSLWNATTQDTVVMWERLFSGLYVANSGGTNVPVARAVFVNLMGHSNNEVVVDSASNPSGTAVNFDSPLFLMALAHLDSLAGGAVFCNLRPNIAAIVIKGAFNRNDLRYAGGIRDNASASDSANFLAVRDSLNSIGVPLTVAVDVDSISVRPNEVAWWKALFGARFAGYTNVGTTQLEGGVGDSLTVGSGNASSTRPVDMFGRFRVRTLYGPGNGASQDTSVYTQIMAADSIVRYWFDGRVSRTAIAPFDDYSPHKLSTNGLGPDSLAWVLTRAGKSAVLTDVQRNEANPQVPRTVGLTARGWWPWQGYYQSALGGPPLKLVGQTGYAISGGRYFAVVTTDSNSVGKAYAFSLEVSPSCAPIPMANLSRFWGGFAHNIWRDIDVIRYDEMTSAAIIDVQIPTVDFLYPQRRANVLVLHASDLSGSTAAIGSFPGRARRPGWWTIKWLNNQFQTINYFMGPNRTLVALGYPEDVTP